MFYDIVFPKNNEKDFIDMAERLGIDGLCFVYPYADKKSVDAAKRNLSKLQKSKIKIEPAFGAVDNKIYKIHEMKEIAVSESSENSRDIIARYKPDVVYNMELGARKDFAKSRNSGLNKAICQFARDNNVIVAFSFANILSSENLQVLIGRTRQNIKLCKKFKVKTAIASFAVSSWGMRSPHDLRAFLLCLGMYTANAKQSIESVSALFK